MIQIRIGNVSSIDNGLVKVTFPDLGDLVSSTLPVIKTWALKNKSFWVPDIKEQVLCLFYGGNLEDGVVIGSLSNDDAKVPSVDPEQAYFAFSDGLTVAHNRSSSVTSMIFPDQSQLQYQAQNNLLAGDFKGTGVLEFAGDLTVTTPNFNIVGDLNVDGNINSSADISDSVRTMQGDRDIYNNHDHNAPPDKTTPPNQEQ